MPKPDDVVLSGPSKEFFIDMITRDLGISDCILDLVDNAIDQAIETQQLDVMTILTNDSASKKAKKSSVSINCSQQMFRIEDNCGGISIDEARNKVFLFGNAELRTAGPGLSVYGIGMKRAFFKLGRLIHIESANQEEFFRMEIDVDKWKAKGDKHWNFQFSSHGLFSQAGARVRRGATKITITNLLKAISNRLSQTSFEKDLIDKLAATYSLFLQSGVSIRVNSTPVKSTLPRIGSGSFTPARQQFTHKGVDVLIIVTLSPKDDHDAHGWYVFCNGRMVLNADKSDRTGWGERLPQFHSKYNHFVGYVYFRSNDVSRLPWTTTKQDILKESEIYQKALSEMQIQARPVLNFLNRLYPGEQEPEGLIEHEVLQEAKTISIDQVEKKQVTFEYEAEPKKGEERPISIQYVKPFRDIKRIKEQLGKRRMSASSVGSYTFDYFIKQEFE